MIDLSKEKRAEYLQVTKRVDNIAQTAIEKTIYPLLNKLIRVTFDLVPAHAADSPWLAKKLVENGILDPTTEQVLEILENEAETLDVNRALGYVSSSSGGELPAPVVLILKGISALVKKVGGVAWVEQLTYENALEYAKKHDKELYAYLIKYPRVCKTVINWLKEFLERGADA